MLLFAIWCYLTNESWEEWMETDYNETKSEFLSYATDEVILSECGRLQFNNKKPLSLNFTWICSNFEFEKPIVEQC